MSQTILPTPLWRRLVSALYDGLLLLAIWMVIGLFAVVISTYLVGVPPKPATVQALAIISAWIFCVRSWTKEGQTLGMRAWRIQVRSSDGTGISLTQASIRFVFAWFSWLLFGLGILWCLIDRQKRSWHDIAAGTEVVTFPKIIRPADAE